MRKPPDGELVEAVSAAGIGGAAASAAGPGAAALAVAGSFVPFALGKLIPAWSRRREREVEDWWQQVVEENGTDEGAAIQIFARQDDPVAQEVVVAALRTLVDRVSPAVVPTIGMLTRKYLREGLEPDVFFRSMSRVLGDLTASEYDAVLVGLAERLPAAGHSVRRIVCRMVTLEGGWQGVQLSDDGADSWRGFECELEHATALFHLLTANGLADRTEPNRSSELIGIVLRRATADRIVEVVPRTR
jgi:hypothetical protein